MRFFIAIEMSSKEVLSCLDELGGLNPHLKLVSPEKLHLTLKFLGDIKMELIPDVIKCLKNVCNHFESFDITFKGLGTFPNLNHMQVIWVGIDKNKEKIIDMHRIIENNLTNLNLRKDINYHPHLTLARVKSIKGKENLKSFLLMHKYTNFGCFKIKKVELKKSVLRFDGPIYTTIFSQEI